MNIDGSIIKEWESAKKASDFLYINKNTIVRCCRGEQKKGAGFIWKFKNKK